jgi:CheY-like chemotaxis protein
MDTSMPISPTRGRRNVLIVDDAPTVAETLQLITSRQGHETRVAHSGEEAVTVIAAWQPDFAILDVMLPGMNGIEFGRILKAMHPECEVVLISGHPGVKDLLEIARKQGELFSILPKPLDPALILALVAGQARLAELAREA